MEENDIPLVSFIGIGLLKHILSRCQTELDLVDLDILAIVQICQIMAKTRKTLSGLV